MKVKHTMNGDERNGWYCYQCPFSTHSVEAAAKHDGSVEQVCSKCECRIDDDGCGCDPKDA